MCNICSSKFLRFAFCASKKREESVLVVMVVVRESRIYLSVRISLLFCSLLSKPRGDDSTTYQFEMSMSRGAFSFSTKRVESIKIVDDNLLLYSICG